MVPSTDLAHIQMETTINSIRARLLSRIDLQQKQLDMLSPSKLELLPAALQSQFPARVMSKLKYCFTSDWEKYNLAEYKKHLVELQGGGQ